ncbi:DNA topoisomerase 2-binding protein 1-A-like isoform X2 [Leguminivora glycinivorella]|uniref:DNA topoisomerase 2-binding protein 1-A-like isoform X2 n=1 Tax=Leguminivora glycinivorella TaxID=1035111 RepID=UPI00200C9106|nr:DNA topoisomerase 2-binding protein 1-A-like isoform X2 [Leguminivora glycinivorella]
MTDVKIKVTFVIPKHCNDENDCSEDMLIAYTACENHRGGGLQAQWAHEKSLTFDEPPLKKDIFVLSEFDGELYEKLKATKCLLVGPRCLSCSLTEGRPIPTKGHPVYTIAMRGLIVTLSGLSKEAKTNLKQKIEWMGGTYSAVLSSESTHLIATSVFSDKYIKAAERGIPVMKDTWVTAVWDTSLKQDINGASPEFNTHRLPPFANLQITTSGLNSNDKKLIMKLVNANGGDFSRVFLSQTTDVLVLTKDSTSSEKYKAAIEFGKVCVTPHWVKDSAALGFALPVSRYKVTSTTTSSPVRDGPVPDMSLNLTRITKEGKPSNFVDESKMADSMMLSGTAKFQDSKRVSGGDEIQKAFEAFDVAAIKKAGPIFDGFCIWVSGLEGMPRERAWACVSKAGGTSFSLIRNQPHRARLNSPP